MKIKGVSYDVGRVMGTDWRPLFDIKVIRRELGIIKNDLHCNAVRICGLEIRRLTLAAEEALKIGLDVWFSPEIWDKGMYKTYSYIAKASEAAEKLRLQWPDKVVFVVASELTLFMKGIVNGGTFLERLSNPSLWENIKKGAHNKPLREFLSKAVDRVRREFRGKITYASLIWEGVDWDIFDIIGVDHYMEERIRGRYIEMLKPLSSFRKPVVITEFGFRTFKGADKAGAVGLGNADYFSLFLHSLPLVGVFFRPRLKVIHERDEALQARNLTAQLKLLDGAGVDGGFIMTFVSPIYPYDEEAAYDLDADNFSLVKSFSAWKRGTTYPDMPWEPKEAFYSVAEYYNK
jgi:hypothetical protein